MHTFYGRRRRPVPGRGIFVTDWILTLTGRYGAAGVFALIFLENIFPPIPSEVLLTFSGFLTTRTNMHLWQVILGATFGSLAGALALYWIGTLASEERLCRFCRGFGRHLGLREEDVHRTLARYASQADKTVLFCRMVPILRSLISIPAGMAHMPIPRFVLLTSLGSLCWNSLLCTAGALLGEAWGILLRYTGFYSSLVWMLTIGFVTFFLLRRAIHRHQKSSSHPFTAKSF